MMTCITGHKNDYIIIMRAIQHKILTATYENSAKWTDSENLLSGLDFKSLETCVFFFE